MSLPRGVLYLRAHTQPDQMCHLKCRRVTSQDAYMLIYVRRDVAVGSAAPIITQEPPLRVQKEVQSANAAHDEVCEKHQEQ